MLRPSVGDKAKTPVAWVLVCGLSPPMASRDLAAALELEGLTPGACTLPMSEWEALHSLSQHNSPHKRKASTIKASQD